MNHPAVLAGVRAAPRQHQAQNPAAPPVRLRPPRRGRGSPRDALSRQHGALADPTEVCGDTPRPLLPGPQLPSLPVMPGLAGHQEEISENQPAKTSVPSCVQLPMGARGHRATSLSSHPHQSWSSHEQAQRATEVPWSDFPLGDLVPRREELLGGVTPAAVFSCFILNEAKHGMDRPACQLHMSHLRITSDRTNMQLLAPPLQVPKTPSNPTPLSHSPSQVPFTPPQIPLWASERGMSLPSPPHQGNLNPSSLQTKAHSRVPFAVLHICCPKGRSPPDSILRCTQPSPLPRWAGGPKPLVSSLTLSARHSVSSVSR
ncbi:uncharacterized protein LOC127393619 [Apus apus]|uniref:uncharacterized protein LOC127393619 n=1 Tax=Apus apus TaxID=8895 RepID=UPI0021F88190|nr:uncharacterized protein LOC127393619 [Apus apus]